MLVRIAARHRDNDSRTGRDRPRRSGDRPMKLPPWISEADLAEAVGIYDRALTTGSPLTGEDDARLCAIASAARMRKAICCGHKWKRRCESVRPPSPD